MDVQGHRGARGYLPENTLPSFARALELGVTTLELDVGVTRDGVVVVHHDRGLNPDIARGPDGKWVARALPINSLTYEELQRYDVGRLRPGSDYAMRFPRQQPVSIGPQDVRADPCTRDDLQLRGSIAHECALRKKIGLFNFGESI